MSEQQLTREQWDTISAELRAPFDPADVDFRPQGKAELGKKTLVVCYVDARAVMDRLDEVVGPGAWSFVFEPVVVEKGQIQIAKGTLTIYGVPKSDVGEASNADPSKGCVSDTLKRCAVLWGVGRYLYDAPKMFGEVDQWGKLTEASLAEVRRKLPRPGGAPSRTERDAPAPLRQPTPIRKPVQPAQPAQPTTPTQAQQPAAPATQPRSGAVADLAGKQVPQEEQQRLVTAIFNAIYAVKDVAATEIDAWLNAHIRPADAPKGPIDAFRLKVGTSSLTISEAKMITEALDGLARLKTEAMAKPHDFTETMWENTVRRYAGDVGAIRAYLERGAAKASVR